MIPYGKQAISEEDIEAVVDVLKSDFLTQGPCVPLFEQALAEYCGAEYGVAVNSATSALHIACLALGLSEGDWLWTTPITFVASANCGLYCGAKVDFVDIDPVYYNLCVDSLKAKLAAAEQNDVLPKVLVVVHLTGQACDMQGIYELSKQYGFSVIEDASHAVGGRYRGKPIGSGDYSDITVFSFHPVKIITSAEGGMAVTNNTSLDEKMRLLRSHGVTRDETLMSHESDGPWYYQQVALGFNYRMTDLQAALGRSQMSELDRFVARRHELVERYNQVLDGLPLILPIQHSDSYSAFHLYVVRLENTSLSRKEVFQRLRGLGIGVNVHYIPVHLQPYYQSFGFREGDFPVSEAYYEAALTLPLYPSMTFAQVELVSDALKEVLL